MDIIIRKAYIYDLKEIFNLNKECLPVYYSLLDHLNMIHSKTNIVLIALDGNCVCGYIICELSYKSCHILSIGVKDIYRKKGIGSMLIDNIKKNIKGMATVLSLFVSVVNHDAIDFYQKNGFIEDEYIEGYYKGCNFTSDDAYKLKILV
jgi:ribosomal protein S18 acetylase RimI-like enzyme